MKDTSLKLTMEVLEKIKEACLSFEDDECEDCKFYSGGNCLFAEADGFNGKLPHRWNLKTKIIVEV